MFADFMIFNGKVRK